MVECLDRGRPHDDPPIGLLRYMTTFTCIRCNMISHVWYTRSAAIFCEACWELPSLIKSRWRQAHYHYKNNQIGFATFKKKALEWERVHGIEGMRKPWSTKRPQRSMVQNAEQFQAANHVWIPQKTMHFCKKLSGRQLPGTRNSYPSPTWKKPSFPPVITKNCESAWDMKRRMASYAEWNVMTLALHNADDVFSRELLKQVKA